MIRELGSHHWKSHSETRSASAHTSRNGNVLMKNKACFSEHGTPYADQYILSGYLASWLFIWTISQCSKYFVFQICNVQQCIKYYTLCITNGHWVTRNWDQLCQTLIKYNYQWEKGNKNLLHVQFRQLSMKVSKLK